MSGLNNNETLPPPQHPASGQTSTAVPTSTSAHNAQTGQVGNNIGDKIKGGWNVFHGTGEGIRGNVNNFLDNVGEQIAGRGDATTTAQAHPPTRSEEQRPAEVAAKGADEMRAGMESLRK